MYLAYQMNAISKPPGFAKDNLISGIGVVRNVVIILYRNVSG